MTDSILRSYYNVSSSMFVPFAAAAADDSLLTGETDGLAIDFTDTTWFGDTTGNQEWNQVRTSSVDSLTSPHTFYTQSGTSPTVVKTSSTGLGWSPHNMFLNSGAPVTQNVTLVVGFVYTYGITGVGTLTGSAGASGAATAGSPVTFTATTTTGTFTVSGGTPTTMQINRGIALTTYIATTGAIKNGLPISYGVGLLCEPAATNLFLRSQDFTNAAWTTDRASWSSGITAPDGSSTAFLLTEDSSVTNTHQFYPTTPIAIADTTQYSISIFAKEPASNSGRYCILGIYDGGGDFALTVGKFDLQAGTCSLDDNNNGTGTADACVMTSIGNGWWHLYFSGTTGTTGAGELPLIRLNTANVGAGNVGDYTGNGVSGLYFWGAQFETGGTGTSYVPTVSASATRATSAPNVATSAYPHTNTNGTFIAWVTPRFINHAQISRILFLGDGTANELLYMAYDPTASPDTIGLAITDGGTPQVVAATTDAGTASLAGNKAACFYKLNDSGVVVDGSAEVVDTGCTMPTVTTLHLGYDQQTIQRELNGTIRRLIYVPRRMTQTEMQSKTT